MSETVAFVIGHHWINWCPPVVLHLRRYPSLCFNHGGIEMNHKLVGYIIAGTLSTALAFASPALAQKGGGGGMGGGGHGGGMGGGGGHAGGMGGGMAAGSPGGGMGGGHVGGMGGGARFGGSSAGAHVGGMGGASRFSGSRFAGSQFAHPGPSSRSSSFAFRHGSFHHHHRHFNRFAFVGAGPLAYAAYDSCYRKRWTPYGLRWVNVCGDYDYY
jgi:hypothetical protein